MRAKLIDRRRASSSGFTLIEVLVALIVVGLGMLAVIQTVSQTANNTSYIREKTIAHWIAMNQLTKVRLEPNAPALDKSSDEVKMAGRDWRWTMEVKQTPVESIRRIEISVRPSEAPEKSSLAYISGFYGTAVAPPGTTQISWKGSQQGGGGRQRERRRDSETEPPPQLQPGEPVPSEPQQPSEEPGS
ncbi:type II secretion system minor pseudopilin GspI [Steroidobacter cummioxidans]|uniref:type II secretion system minor pseudopilin GspI n=1 Tax=Steroidobacter cummioxidans TaxID=1803913 RepID=UPI00137A7368|nr:type II secretion system minor pseudopilin GspI [Steroidobacter cummioxidans]